MKEEKLPSGLPDDFLYKIMEIMKQVSWIGSDVGNSNKLGNDPYGMNQDTVDEAKKLWELYSGARFEESLKNPSARICPGIGSSILGRATLVTVLDEK